MWAAPSPPCLLKSTLFLLSHSSETGKSLLSKVRPRGALLEQPQCTRGRLYLVRVARSTDGLEFESVAGGDSTKSGDVSTTAGILDSKVLSWTQLLTL